MENTRSEEEKIINDKRNLFRLKKEQNNAGIKDIRNLFKLNKWVKGIKDIVLRNIKNLFENEKEEENLYKPVRVNKNNFQTNNYIEYKSNGDKNKLLLVEEYFNKIRPCLKHIINDLKKSGTWKTQLTISVNFISFRDGNNEECIMHLKSDNNYD